MIRILETTKAIRMDDQLSEKRKDLPPKLSNPTFYREWKVQMKLHFMRFGVWELVIGGEERPTEAKELQKYERRVAGPRERWLRNLRKLQP